MNEQAITAPEPTPPINLRPKDAARALGISRRKLWELTADQGSGIPHLRLGRAVLYPVDALKAWVAARTEGGVK
ncbi:helix-turn-helix domain-containing protein [Mucisphaera sp.]|uniref:helix-turn-helix domain-containing protein n=1 Tax=Mucisphaera sp. TaxID=2913024 RepID=UPI003D0D0548